MDETEQAILQLLNARDAGKTICPSEAARRLNPGNWRERMPEVRATAAALAEQGRVAITQGGAVADPQTLVGPWRIRLP